MYPVTKPLIVVYPNLHPRFEAASVKVCCTLVGSMPRMGSKLYNRVMVERISHRHWAGAQTVQPPKAFKPLLLEINRKRLTWKMMRGVEDHVDRVQGLEADLQQDRGAKAQSEVFQIGQGMGRKAQGILPEDLPEVAALQRMSLTLTAYEKLCWK